MRLLSLILVCSLLACASASWKHKVNAKKVPKTIAKKVGKRNAANFDDIRWKNGNVCYFFDAGESQELKTLFASAIAEYTAKVPGCITWVVGSAASPDCVKVTTKDGDGCYSTFTGKQDGIQILNLKGWGNGCRVGAAVHEMMHVLGFNHEHTRPDRDQWVELHLENVEPSNPAFKEEISEKCDPGNCDTLGLAYDYCSIMHYQPDSFPKAPGLVTIKPIKSTVGLPCSGPGQRDGLSALDVKKIKKFYEPENAVCKN